jgi:hypothetical protein
MMLSEMNVDLLAWVHSREFEVHVFAISYDNIEELRLEEKITNDGYKSGWLLQQRTETWVNSAVIAKFAPNYYAKLGTALVHMPGSIQLPVAVKVDLVVL